MKVTVISNGSLSLAIVPETDLERAAVTELFKGPIEVTTHDKLQILNHALNDAVVITVKQQ